MRQFPWEIIYIIIINLIKDTFKHHTAIHLFFYKHPVYKQLTLGEQIAKQLSGLNSVSLSNNENYRLKKSGSFPL